MYIVADIGGTKTRIAGSADLETFGEPIIIDTPKEYESGLHSIVVAAQEIAGGDSITCVVAGVPALLSRDRRTIASAATNIPAWTGKPLANDLEAALSAKAYLENDVALIGLGEAVYGAGKGAHIMMYLTISTGVNGVRIVDQTIDPAVFGAAIGHQYTSVTSDDTTWEQLLSGAAIERKYGKHPRDLGADSPVWEDLASITAFGLHTAILHWSPERIVIGGSMLKDIGISVDRVQFHLARISKVLPEVPEVVHSGLGDLGGLWGGLAFIKQIA